MTKQMITHRGDGIALEQRRLALGLSREALGAAAGGIASATVKRVERSEVQPHPSTLAALTQALELGEALHDDDEAAENGPVEKAANTDGHQRV